MTIRPLPDARRADMAKWMMRRYRRVRVVGASMEATLKEGDVVLVNPKAYVSTPPANGDIVVAQHPQQPELEIIKRIRFTDDDGAYLSSDNSDTDAADSRRFGVVPLNLITGRVVARVP